jgi:SAM-dependent MidA family methyltransferase
VPEGALIVLANEFFDALPVQAVMCAIGWHERDRDRRGRRYIRRRSRSDTAVRPALAAGLGAAEIGGAPSDRSK